MASLTARHVLANLSKCSTARLLNCTNTCVGNMGKRFLFNAEILGVDKYERQRLSVKERIGDMHEKFRTRMDEYMDTATKNTIFTDDLKTMIHLAEIEDLDTATRMIKRFHKQNDDLRFSTFVFGPLVARLMHVLNQPERVLALVTDENLSGFFDQMSSNVIVMDLLFENGHHDDVRRMLARVSERQVGGAKYPVDCVTLFLAACIKQNTPESLEASLTLLRDCRSAGSRVAFRGVVYAAILALRQEDAATALEILSLAQLSETKTPPMAYSNVKIMTYCQLGRVEEAVRLLRTVLSNDRPDYFQQGGEIFEEVLSAVAAAVAAADDTVLARTYELVARGLREENHVANTTIDEYIYRPIVRRRRLQEGYRAGRHEGEGGGGRRPGLGRGEAGVSF